MPDPFFSVLLSNPSSHVTIKAYEKFHSPGNFGQTYEAMEV